MDAELKPYARWHQNEVTVRDSQRIEWPSNFHHVVTTRLLADFLNRAYMAGYQDAAGEMQAHAAKMRARKQPNAKGA